MGIKRLWDADFPFFYDIEAATAGPGVVSPMPTKEQDPIQQAIDTWVFKETRPAQELCATLRKALDAYEKAALEDAQIRARACVLIALGMADEPPASLPLMASREALQDALEALQDLLEPPQPEAALPEPEAAPPWNDPQLIEEARRVLHEVSANDLDGDHPLRLAHRLQIHVAECRNLMDKIPVQHPTHQALVGALRRLGAIRGEANVDTFIKGLARHHREDWPRVIRQAREALTKYDLDADQGPSSTPEKRKKGNGQAPERDSSPEQVSLPKLLAAQANGRMVVIFGGLRVEEKLRSLKDRTGIIAEWMESEEGSPRNSSNGISRVRKGKVSGVVILEGLLSHPLWRSLADTCDAEGIPYAMGGRGGIGSVVQCLETFEAKG